MPANYAPVPERATDVLRDLRERGVKLWSENGQLRYKAPKGILTPFEIERLKRVRDALVALLEEAAPIEAQSDPDSLVYRAPLTYTQYAHWLKCQLDHRPGIRNIVSATRLQGNLNMEALKHSFSVLVHRHHALQTRIVIRDGHPHQEVGGASHFELETADLRMAPAGDHEVEIRRHIQDIALQPVNVCQGPLFVARLLCLGSDEHVLVVALEHLIADAASMNVLLRDLFAAYDRFESGLDAQPLTIPLQLSDRALWQKQAERAFINNHNRYWMDHLLSFSGVRFPTDNLEETEIHSGWGVVSLEVASSLKTLLLEWCRVNKTTLAMGVFTAYVALVFRWCRVSEAIVLNQVNGRASPELEHAIGYFAYVLYLRLTLAENDTFESLLERTTKEYFPAAEHADEGYLETLVPTPAFTKNTCFNWRPRVVAPDETRKGQTLGRSPIPVQYRVLPSLGGDADPTIGVVETLEGLNLTVEFPLNRFTFETMQRFGRALLAFLAQLSERPNMRIHDLAFDA